MVVKNPTKWTPPSGTGSVVTIGTVFLVDNSGNFLVDNSGNFLVTNTTVNEPKNPTAWTASGA